MGESPSLERDSVSLKIRTLRLGELLEQNLGESQLFSLRRDELAWARITVLAYCYAHATEIQLKNNIPKTQTSQFIPSKTSITHKFMVQTKSMQKWFLKTQNIASLTSV